jgi:hypothetical protein
MSVLTLMHQNQRQPRPMSASAGFVPGSEQAQWF